MANNPAPAATVYYDQPVRLFALVAVLWGIVGMLVGVIIAAQLTWPELNLGIPFLTYGRLRPLHTNAVIFAFGGSALTDASIAVPHGRSAAAIGHGIPVTYVPARNTVFLALALAMAETRGAQAIVLGINARYQPISNDAAAAYPTNTNAQIIVAQA